MKMPREDVKVVREADEVLYEGVKVPHEGRKWLTKAIKPDTNVCANDPGQLAAWISASHVETAPKKQSSTP